MSDATADLPGSLHMSSTFAFVGRTTELEKLRSLMPRAEGEGRRIVLLGGEPGSGKSRLVREFAAEIADERALVLYGACDAVVRTPFGPFVEALDHLVRVTDPDELRAALGTGGGELARLLPDLPQAVGDLPPPAEADPDTERHRLHTAVTELLGAISRRRPVLLIVEDAHWADAGSLLLIRHLARAAGNARLLLLATFRDTATEMPEALSETLADLRRSDAVVRLGLGGLAPADVVEFVRRSAGGELGTELDELAGQIHALTEGNAFLVCELWRSLVETGTVEIGAGQIRVNRPPAALGSPESVREVVSQRLSRLSPGTRDLLELAATAGPEFELDVVRRAASIEEPLLLAGLDEAARSGMIEEPGAPGQPGRFSHELLRRALYDRLSGLRRAELHLRIGSALEEAGTPSRRRLADLAHHFAAAAVLGESARALEYNRLAARAAAETLDFEEAAQRFGTALELTPESAAERAGLFLELGDASHRAGKALDAIAAFRSAAELARELGDAELLARAAIGLEEACWRPGLANEGAVSLLEEAAAALEDQHSGLRVGLLAGLARALDFQGDHERGALVRTNAITMARRLDDPLALASVLMRSYWSRGTSSLDEILEMLTESRNLGEVLGNAEIQAEAMSWRVPSFVARADLGSARREVAVLSETAEQTAQPFIMHVATHYDSAIALCDGRLEEAERLAMRSDEWSRLLTGRDASGTHGIQMFSIRREQGRLAELAPVIRILAAGDRRAGPWRPGAASLLVELGMEEEARRELAAVAADGLDPFRESLWLASLTYLTDACAALGDRATAALVYPELEPLAGKNVMIGHLVACYGAADRYLGMLAATLGDLPRASAHFETALELNRRMGARTWLAHTAYEYGRALLAGDPEEPDRARATELLGVAATEARELGLRSLSARIESLGSPVAGDELPDGLSPREVQVIGLVAQGLSNREIGRELTISEHTAANHVRSILAKSGCANRTEAASYAHRNGLIA